MRECLSQSDGVAAILDNKLCHWTQF